MLPLAGEEWSVMDLKELEDRRLVSVRNAATAGSVEARIAHSQLALGYAARISLCKPKFDIAV